MYHFTDQMGRIVGLPTWPPRRIISLVPSQTELLYDLGLDGEVVGITKFCVHPVEWFQQKKRVGGTKTVHLEKVEALNPDLIIGNKEENEEAQIRALETRFPVWMSDIQTLEDAFAMIRSVGALTGKAPAADDLATGIARSFTELALTDDEARLNVAYFIWRKPYMVAGGQTFIDAMLRAGGFENVFRDRDRYPEIRLEELAARRPDAVFLSSEPFPFSEKHFAAFQEVCPGIPIRVVDGEMFSWYGSRLQYAPAYFKQVKQSLISQHKFE